MIDLKRSAQALNQQPVAPAPPVAAVLRRAGQIRAWRRLATVAILGSIALVAVAVAEAQAAHSPKHLVVSEPTTIALPTTSIPVPRLVARPELLIAHEPQQPGKVVVIDTASGRTTRVIGVDYDPYLRNGFAFAKKAGLGLWTRLNEQEQRLELVQVPLAGGKKQVIGSTNLRVDERLAPRPPLLTALDPIGSKLWTSGDTIIDLDTGNKHRIAAPLVEAGWNWATATWLPDGRLLMVKARRIPESCYSFGSPGGPPPTTTAECVTTPASRARGSQALVYDLNDPAAGWSATAAPDRDEGWAGLRILGPGRLPSTVVVVDEHIEGDITHPEVMTINLDSGAIIDARPFPTDANVLSVDASGTNILFTSNRLLESVSWADPNPTTIRRQVAEATW